MKKANKFAAVIATILGLVALAISPVGPAPFPDDSAGSNIAVGPAPFPDDSAGGNLKVGPAPFPDDSAGGNLA